MALTLYRITATKKLVVVDSATPPSGGVAVTAASTTNLVDTAPWTRTLDAATSHVTDWHPAEYPPSTPEMFTSEAQLLSLNSSSQAFTYDGLNVLDPAGQSITFTTKLQNIVDPVVWTSSPVGLLTSTSDAGATLTSANFGANTSVTVTATAGTNSDVISIVRLTDGSTVLVGYLTNESHTLPSDSSGTVSVYTGATGTFKVYYGLTEVTSACIFAGVGVNCAGSVTVAGVYTVSSGIAAGTDLSTYTITATHPTYGAITKVFSISKSKAGVSAVISDLSNDNHTVPTDSSGSNGNFTGCATTMSVFLGSTDDSANWTYAVTKSAGVTCTEAVTSRTQTVTAMTTDTGTVTIVASKAGFASQTQVFSISKAKSGVAYGINLSDNSVRKSSAGVLSPTSLTLTASKIDVSGITAYTGRFKIYLNGSATATYTSAADEASKAYTVTATDATIKCELYLAGGTTTLVDTETVLVVADGANGTNGTNGSNGSNGTRGSGEFYAVGSSWIDSTADNAVYAVYPLLTYPAGLVYGDTVTISNNSNFVNVKYWNGSAWTALGTVIDGSLIVTNSITAAKINSNGLSIKDAYGNIILAAGSALDFSNVGGSTKPAPNATVGATFGTNISGQIPVGGASTYIANGALDTLQVKGNAITAMEAFNSTTSVYINIPTTATYTSTTAARPGSSSSDALILGPFSITPVDIATKRIITFTCQVITYDAGGLLYFDFRTGTSILNNIVRHYLTPNNSQSTYGYGQNASGTNVIQLMTANIVSISFAYDVSANTAVNLYVYAGTETGRSGFDWTIKPRVDYIMMTSVTGKR